MVTVAQARQQLEQQKATLRQRITQIERTELPKLTPEQLRGRTRADILVRQKEQRQITDIREQELQKAKQFERQLSGSESQIRRAEETLRKQSVLQQDIKSAFEAFDRGSLKPGANKRVVSIFDQIQSSAGAQKVLKDLERQGIKPVFVGGEAVGFEDVLTLQSIEIPPISFPRELITPVPTPFTVAPLPIAPQITPLPSKFIPTGARIPRLTVEIAPSRIEQFKRSIKQATPELKFVPEGDVKRGLQKVIGAISGTTAFTKAKLSGEVAQLRDIEGKRIFTPTQARKLTDLAVETVGGFVAGGVTGKALTLARGATFAALPKGLKEGNKFKKIIKTFDVVALGGLTAVQVASISKTFREQGEDAAILQTIGLISFGAGFAKTGLKPSAQAEKEFKDLASTLKKAVPKDKKGEFPRRRKKRKKGEIQVLEQLSAEEVQEARGLVGALEKRLLEAKTPKEQLRILAEIKGKLKTPQAQKNFRELVLSLIEKRYIKSS